MYGSTYSRLQLILDKATGVVFVSGLTKLCSEVNYSSIGRSATKDLFFGLSEMVLNEDIKIVSDSMMVIFWDWY